MLLREGPAQKAFCGMSPNLASGGRGGTGDGGGEGAGKRCKPSSHGHLTCNYTQPRKQRVYFFKKRLTGRVFLWTDYIIFRKIKIIEILEIFHENW